MKNQGWGKGDGNGSKNGNRAGKNVGWGVAGSGGGDRVEYQAGNLFFQNQIEREWLSTKVAAQFLRLSENALRIMVHRNQIRFHKIGRRLRFQVSDCQSLFQRGGA
jgi:excisionase family DNA binding protein